MSTINRPDGAFDQAELARCVLRELNAFVESIRVMNKQGGMSDHVDALSELACRHASEWKAHFEGQIELFRLQDGESEGGAA